jgi:archaellum component FlaC
VSSAIHALYVVFILISASKNSELSAAQVIIMKQAVNKVRETVQRLATDHRDLHSTVSKVGKAIDRVRNVTLHCKQ